METFNPVSSPPAQRWPCGPECAYAQPLPGTYGEWHWCSHPHTGGRVARDGRDCASYVAAGTVPVPAKSAAGRN